MVSACGHHGRSTASTTINLALVSSAAWAATRTASGSNGTASVARITTLLREWLPRSSTGGSTVVESRTFTPPIFADGRPYGKDLADTTGWGRAVGPPPQGSSAQCWSVATPAGGTSSGIVGAHRRSASFCLSWNTTLMMYSTAAMQSTPMPSNTIVLLVLP